MYEDQTFDVILQRMLSRVPETMDKRESSPIYAALAPAAVELTSMYIALTACWQRHLETRHQGNI